MTSEEMFAGFSVAAGKDRFDEEITLGGEPNDCKVSGQDTSGAMCVFEFSGSGGGPRHLHRDQDEWIYVLEGDFTFEIGARQFRLGPGESAFLPRNVPHAWAADPNRKGKVLDVYQPAGQMEDFFREIGKHKASLVHEALDFDAFRRLFQDHGMELTGPPILGEWKIEDDGRMVQLA
jgi:quercetin dioxygenase-like cupin family protein